MGERYKVCPREIQNYVRGLYGKPPAPIDDSIIKKIIKNQEVITVRPADLIPPAWEKGKQEMADISEKEEDILTYLLFPQVALKFFEDRKLRANEENPQILSADQVGQEIIETKTDI
jgi:oxaloacetate decarboxylase alpha subunit